MDMIYRGQAHGSVAERLMACGFRTNALRTNGLLLKDEWKVIDEAVLSSAKTRLVGAADLIRRGLTYDPKSGLGQTMLQSYKSSSMDAAELSMDGMTRGKNDRPDFGVDYLPLPIVHKDFHLSIRQINEMRNNGYALDATAAEEASRSVAEKVDDIVFNGADYAFGSGNIYGYTNFPSVNSYTISDWNASATTGATILEEVLGMIAAAHAVGHYGPFVLYVPTDYEAVLGDDYKAESDKSLRMRLLEIEGLEDIRVSVDLADNKICLVEMQRSTVRLVNPVQIQTVQWDTEGGMRVNFKVIAIMVPQIRADQDGNCGVVYGTTA